MNSFSQDRLINRVVALLGATGLAAFSGLPALAQANSSPNNGVLNSVNCSASVNSGVGGSIDDRASSQVGLSRNSNSSQSSYDTATIPQNRSDAMNQPQDSSISYKSNSMSRDGQFSARNPNAAIPFRSNGPAGTSGGESNLNLRMLGASNGATFMQSAMPSGTNNRASAQERSSSYQTVNPASTECLPGAVNKR